MNKRINAKGFTLLELLVVLVLISLMAALTVPRLAGSLSQLGLKTSAQKVSAGLRFLRSKAATEKKTFLAVFQMDERILVFKRPGQRDFEGGQDLSFKDLKTLRLPDGIYFDRGIPVHGDEVGSGEFLIAFFPSGGSSGGIIVLANESGHQFAVFTDLITGAVKIDEI